MLTHSPIPPVSNAPPLPASLLCAAAMVLGCVITQVRGEGLGNLYRWTDENGVIHYTDQIPPAQVEKGHAELTEQGLRVKVVPPAPTIEEIRLDKELQYLRNHQARLIEQQKAADRALLRTFNSVEDLLSARDRKIAVIDANIQIDRGNIRRQQEWLQGRRTEATNLERENKPVPQQLTEGITKSEGYIRDSYATMVEREQQKERIREDFNRDLKRFRQLKDIPEDKTNLAETQTKVTPPHLVKCKDRDQCDQYWERAVAFAKSQATTQVRNSNDDILITALPESPQDLGLILCRFPDNDRITTSIFLDLQCRNQSTSDLNCQDERSKQILRAFQGAVTGAGTIR